MSDIQLLTDALFAEIASRAASSPRQRMNHNFHDGPTDNPHRMLNALLRGTYVRPHRHVTPPKSEAFLPLTGRVGIVCFSDGGDVTATHELSADGPVRGIDLPAGIWHTVMALSDVSVCYEVKPGPWEPASDKDFAPWAPEEGDPSAAAYLRSMEALFA